MTDLVASGDASLKAGNHDEAIAHYTAALSQKPDVPKWLIKRSTAYQRSARYQEALLDAEAAVRAAVQRQRRELIAEAQLRRGISLFKLGRLADAHYVLDLVQRIDPREKSLSMWQAQVDAKFVLLDKDDPMATPTVSDFPHEAQPTPAAASAAPKTGNAVDTSSTQKTPQKIRHDWYQTDANVVVAIMAKGVSKDDTKVNVTPTSLRVALALPSQPPYEFRVDKLCGDVDPAGSSHRVLSTKVEVTLKKQSSGQKWPALEANRVSSIPADGRATALAQPQQQSPAYPTSSRSGPKNWDKIATSFNKPAAESSKDGEKTADETYIDEDMDDVSDPANHFFQKLFKNSDDDTRRAMMKSFQESGGTALNTNWGQVKEGRVPVQPPTGMEEKKWEG